MTWSTESTCETTATAQAVWDRWTTASSWSEDDASCQWATLEEPLKVGSKGKVRTTGPAQNFTFTEVVPLKKMTFTISLPLAVLAFPHTLGAGSSPSTVRVTHGIVITGPLAPVFGFLVGRKLARELPRVVRLVTEHAVLAEA
ncbi:MAG: hypothetical protein JWM02_1518 [Frankiales bacterium]|nr:hypothetical protein [Frankiales bacterium]